MRGEERFHSGEIPQQIVGQRQRRRISSASILASGGRSRRSQVQPVHSAVVTAGRGAAGEQETAG